MTNIAATPQDADADHDLVFYDTDGPGEEDGFPWAFAPDDSAFCERFATESEALDFADTWIAARG